MSLAKNKKRLKKILELCPSFISRLLLYKGYNNVTKQLNLSHQELKKLQQDKVNKIITSAKQTPFYEQYKAANSINDFPVISKQDVINKAHLLQNPNYSNLLELQTSGSTGEPFKFKRLINEERIEYIYVIRHFHRFGYRPGKKMAALRSYVPKDENAPTSTYSKLQNIHWFSAYHMDDHNIQSYIDILNHNKIGFMIAYPSSAYLLADYCKRKNIQLPHLKAILVSSEKMIQSWKILINEALPDTELIDRYGTAEFTSSLTFCSKCDGFHINEDYSLTELVHFEGNRYHIVSTGFLNTAFPLIRYNTMDIFKLDEIKPSCCEHGSEVYVGEIEGRSSDLIFSSDKYLPGVNFYTAFYKYHSEIKQFQLIQKDKESLNILLALKDDFNKEDLKTLLDNLSTDLKLRTGDLSLNFEVVDEIPRDKKTGKIKNIISLI